MWEFLLLLYLKKCFQACGDCGEKLESITLGGTASRRQLNPIQELATSHDFKINLTFDFLILEAGSTSSGGFWALLILFFRTEPLF